MHNEKLTVNSVLRQKDLDSFIFKLNINNKKYLLLYPVEEKNLLVNYKNCIVYIDYRNIPPHTYELAKDKINNRYKIPFLDLEKFLDKYSIISNTRRYEELERFMS